MNLELFFREYDSLWEEPVMTLATCNDFGIPHAAAIYFAARWKISTEKLSGLDSQHQRESESATNRTHSELELYFFSEPQSRHCQDLASNPQAAAEIHPFRDDWREIRGLQLQGKVTRIERGAAWDNAWDLYARKFTFVTGIQSIVARNWLYCFQPAWMRLVDNRRGFGYKTEWQIA